MTFTVYNSCQEWAGKTSKGNAIPLCLMSLLPIIGLPPHTSNPSRWNQRMEWMMRRAKKASDWVWTNVMAQQKKQRWWLGGLVGTHRWEWKIGEQLGPPPLPAGRPLASSWNPRPAVTTSRSQRTPVHATSFLAPRVDYCFTTTRVYTSTGQWPAPVAYTSAGHRPLLTPPVGWPTTRGAPRVYQLARHWNTHKRCPSYALAVSWLLNLKIQKSRGHWPLVWFTSDHQTTSTARICKEWHTSHRHKQW